jgi:uncharacterized membrane protein
MFQVSVSVFINRAIQDVFDYSLDPANTPAWQTDVVEHVHDGDMVAGSTGRFVQKFMGREIDSNYEVTSINPPYESCFQTTSGPVQFQGCQRYEEVDGGTQMTFEVEGEPGGFFKVAEGMVRKQLASTLERDLNTLKAVMEG